MQDASRSAAIAGQATRIRQKTVSVCIACGGHIASSLSCVEILTVLYYGGYLNITPSMVNNPERDRFILSKGHATPVLYTILADLGFFPHEWLTEHYRRGECYLGGEASAKVPGVEWSTGSLGHGLGVACGLAHSGKMEGAPRRHYVLLGDAECTEGAVWEAALYAAARRLDNLTVIVDRNRVGALEYTDDFTALEPFADKWRSFGWQTQECDGHDIAALDAAFINVRQECNGKPTVIIAHTVKGKGISFIENDPAWHAKTLNKPEEIVKARQELHLEEKA